MAQDEPTMPFPDGIEDLVTPQDQLVPAIYMRDANGNRIFIPRTSYEEFDQRNQLLNNNRPERRAYTYDSITLTALAEQQRCELEVEAKITLDHGESTGDVTVALEMPNFHRLEPLEVQGMQRVRQTYDKALKSHTITGEPTQLQVTVRGKFSARVDQVDDQNRLQFSLPVAPTTITLKVPQQGAAGIVTGTNGDEVVRHSQLPDDQGSQIVVEASGGEFAIDWGTSQPQKPEKQSLEVEGDWKINWEDPQQSPRIEVTYTVRNLSGNVRPLDMQIPSNYSLSPLSFSEVSINAINNTTYRVTPTIADTPRLTFQFQVDVPSADYRDTSPLELRGASIENSIRETGTIKVETPRDHRLRWSDATFVRPLGSTSSADGEGRTISVTTGDDFDCRSG